LTQLRRAVLWGSFRAVCRGVVALGRFVYGLEVQGQEHLPAQGPLILVPRRISRVDFFCFALFGSKEWSGMTGAMATSNRRIGAWVGRELGFLPTLKGKGRSGISLRRAYRLLKQGKIVGMADEGEGAWDGRWQPLHSGAAWLAL
jgi:1-acyl-sn-glycerol-3-phosphate acyltransferase